VRLVQKRTVNGDWRFDNLSRSNLQSHVNSVWKWLVCLEMTPMPTMKLQRVSGESKWRRKRMSKVAFQPWLKFRFDYMGFVQTFQTRLKKRARIFSSGWILLHVIANLILRGFDSETELKSEARLLQGFCKAFARLLQVSVPAFQSHSLKIVCTVDSRGNASRLYHIIVY